MTIINRYIIWEILKFIFILMVALLVIYVAVDFFENIEGFLEEKLPPARIAAFFLYKLPFVVAQMLPLCVLLALIIVFGIMSKNNEILAIKTGGVSHFRLFMPAMAVGVVFSVVLFLLAEILVPLTIVRANRILLEEVKKDKVFELRERNIWMKSNRQIIHIKFYKPQARSLHGITIYSFDEDFRLTRRLDAHQALYRDGRWVFFGVLTQDLNPAENSYQNQFHGRLVEPLDVVPEDFKTAVRAADEMGLFELLRFIEKVEAEGYDATTYRVDFHNKIAFPLVCIVMSVLGVGLGMRHSMKGKLPLAVSLGIGIAFLYWTVHSLFISLGYGEALPPMLAAWSTTLLSLFASAFVFLSDA